MRVYAHDGFYESEDEVPIYYRVNGDATYIGGVSVRGEISGKVGDYKLKDFNNDSYPDKYNAGSPLPIAHGGWVNELKWKNFDLNMLFSFSLGRKVIRTAGEQMFVSIPVILIIDVISGVHLEIKLIFLNMVRRLCLYLIVISRQILLVCDN
ncbi:MAG: hypothetical protein ACLU4J_14905 [Butyricimonas paravirosa]